MIQGWAGFVMPQWDPEKVDHLEPIEDDEAVEMTGGSRARKGSSPGISTGANVVGAHRLAERLGPDAVIVTLAVDTGFKYMSVTPSATTRPHSPNSGRCLGPDLLSPSELKAPRLDPFRVRETFLNTRAWRGSPQATFPRTRTR